MTVSASTSHRFSRATLQGMRCRIRPSCGTSSRSLRSPSTKLIAEAWDAAGLYQVGTFIGDAWKEWNGRFRDDVRSFFRGDEGMATRFADRLLGSPDVYGHKQREAEANVNFVTCHDGFSLNDLVSYNEKHNEANGEHNRDGADDNRSWNCGVEGPTNDPQIERLRNRQVKNMLTVTMLSLGVPMILMGDEVRRTQHGNNNAYCHDDESNWFDWTLVEQHADVLRFVTLLAARRTLREGNERRQPHRHVAPRQDRVARREPASAGLESPVAQRRVWRRDEARGPRSAPDHECVLGSARLRAPERARPRRVAPVDRYVTRIAGGHRSVAVGGTGR